MLSTDFPFASSTRRLSARSPRTTHRRVLGSALGLAGAASILACAGGSGEEPTASRDPWVYANSGRTLTVLSRAEGPEGAFPRIAEGPTVLATRGAEGLFALDLHSLALDGDELAFTARETAVEGENWFVNWADTPALASDGSSVTWLKKVAADTYDYHVAWARRGAEGTFEEQGSLHDDEGAGEHGFCSWLSLGDGRQLALWLDGRAIREGGPMQVRSRLVEADGTRGPETLVDPRACDCCPTTLALLDDGSVLAAWRDRGEDEVRDIALARWTEAEGWSAPFSVHEDGWRIPGCPVNGPVLAARGSRVALAWYTLGTDDAPRVWCARSEDGGETFGEPLRVDGGAALGQLDLAWSSDGKLLASWHEGDGAAGTASWRARVLHPEVGETLEVAPTTGGRGDGRARLLGLEDSWLLVWSTAESPRTLAAARLAER